MLRLYGTPQTRTFRPLWMLEELGVPYELMKADFANGDTRTAEFLAINPNGHVPALVDGDLALYESMAINLYLAEKYGQGTLWPPSAPDRARAVQWSFWVVNECERPLFDVLFGRGGSARGGAGCSARWPGRRSADAQRPGGQGTEQRGRSRGSSRHRSRSASRTAK